MMVIINCSRKCCIIYFLFLLSRNSLYLKAIPVALIPIKNAIIMFENPKKGEMTKTVKYAAQTVQKIIFSNSGWILLMSV